MTEVLFLLLVFVFDWRLGLAVLLLDAVWGAVT